MGSAMCPIKVASSQWI